MSALASTLPHPMTSSATPSTAVSAAERPNAHCAQCGIPIRLMHVMLCDPCLSDRLDAHRAAAGSEPLARVTRTWS